MPDTRDILSASNLVQNTTELDFSSAFQSPPSAYGPVPFYWWTGGKLDRERIAWQLDQLCEKGVRQTIISYPHLPDGSNDPGDPPLFSPEWWELLRWFLSACRKRGMTAGFQDYTLVGPILHEIGRATPGMQGGQMSCSAARVTGPAMLRLNAESGTLVIGAWAYPLAGGVPQTTARVALIDLVRDAELAWNAPAGEWLVALVFARLNDFDPLHPDSGRLAIGRLYEPFERECPEDFGKSLTLFFQDELDFGSRMPFWSNQLFEAFLAIKGYDLYPLLPALWHDLGPTTEKIRLDFADVVVRRAEECYFKPIFRWHEERGLLFGHDNSGRGRMAEGRSFYGDYFRAMRWYSAPGCDDPKIHGARAFKGLKVNSSIAHLYQRPRVWVEAFHSSGWGTTPAEVLAAIREDLAYGATVVNLHGLYYTTRGGWWEWAPPDFHFRQPYWQHAQSLNSYFTRLCWILSQGHHCCNVAIVYPIAALDAAPADPALHGIVAHVGNEALDGPENEVIHPEESAFHLGKRLFDHACDFDFIDFESLERAMPGEGELSVGGGSYRVLLLPAMSAVHFSTLAKARDFVRSGGVVIAYGCLPRASERAGREDPELLALLEEIFGGVSDDSDLAKNHPGGGRALFIRRGEAAVLEAINSTIERDVSADVPLQVLHRRMADREVFYLFNPANQPVTAKLGFRDSGRAEIWNAWTGDVEAVSTTEPLHFGAREERLLVIHRNEAATDVASGRAGEQGMLVETLDGHWDFEVVPCLDNRFGDFSLPATPGAMGPQARRFRYADDFGCAENWQAPAFDDGNWRETTYSFGPQLEFIGPLPPESDFAAIEKSLLDGGAQFAWQPYVFSRRWGIERDPFLTDWLSGPHGLKGAVPDEYIDFHADLPGSVWYLRAKVLVAEDGEHTLHAGSRSAYQVWINGCPAISQHESLAPGRYPPWNIPHYECEPRQTRVKLSRGGNDLLLKLTQPEGQRARAYVVFDAPPAETGALALRWFTDPTVPRPCLPATPARVAIRFRLVGPPGVREFCFAARGPAQAWVDGAAVPLEDLGCSADGVHHYRARLAAEMPDPVLIALRVEAPGDSHAGDALPEPVSFSCGRGRILLGDWCQHGLATYSGTAVYSHPFEIPDAESPVVLDLGKLSATAEVRVNGQLAATLVAPPWECDITRYLQSGKNQLAITVANTLANHYSIGIPTPYAFEHQTPSGLFGPVRLIANP